MKSHVLRPLWVALGALALLLVVRSMSVPDDFGVQGESFTTSYHRLGSIDDWRAIPVKYRGSKYCRECHEENSEAISNSAHSPIQCENCHGPARNHPDDPEALEIDSSRSLCLRCHTKLPYPSSDRGDIPGFAPGGHNHDAECVSCHNPHNPEEEVSS